MRQAAAGGGPRLMKRSLLLSGGLGEVLLYSLHTLLLLFRRSAAAMFQGDSLATQVGGRCIARGLVDRSGRS